MLMALDPGQGMLKEKKSQVIPKQYFSFLGPLLATRCIVTTRGYRAPGLRIPCRAVQIGREIESDPGAWPLADHWNRKRTWYHS